MTFKYTDISEIWKTVKDESEWLAFDQKDKFICSDTTPKKVLKKASKLGCKQPIIADKQRFDPESMFFYIQQENW